MALSYSGTIYHLKSIISTDIYLLINFSIVIAAFAIKVSLVIFQNSYLGNFEEEHGARLTYYLIIYTF